MPKAQKDDFALHKRLTVGEETATEELFDRLLTPLINKISSFSQYRKLHKYEPNLIWDAVTDALFNYAEAPQKYNPEKATLQYYLQMSAEGDLKNTLAKYKREKAAKENLGKFVELGQIQRNKEIGEFSKEEEKSIEENLWKRIKEIVPNKQDQEVVQLILDGERETELYVQILKLDDLSIEEQRREVKRAKDRLKAKLKRAGWEGYLELKSNVNK